VFHALSNSTSVIDNTQWNADWNNLSNPMICMSSSDFTEMKKEEENLCSYSGNCTQAQVSQIKSFIKRIEGMRK
jgi:hypothetical protein